MLLRPLALALGMVAALSWTSAGSAQTTKIKMMLDWKYQGIHAWYFQARDKGYFTQEGLDVTIDQGEGSAAAIPRIMSGAYDAGVGDVNAIIQQAAARPGEHPVMVYMVYNKAPFSIVTKKGGPIRSLKDVEGRRLTAGAGSATHRLFPLLAKLNGIDVSKVEVLNITPTLQEQMMLQGKADGGFVFTISSYMNLVGMRQDPDRDFNYIQYSDYGILAYSNGVMVSQKLLKENPRAVAGFVRAINRAMVELTADPERAGRIMNGIEPIISAEIEEKRVAFAYKNYIYTDETVRLGAGDVSDDRMTKAIAQIVEAFELPRTPTAADVFDRSFLPPRDQRALVAPKVKAE